MKKYNEFLNEEIDFKIYETDFKLIKNKNLEQEIDEYQFTTTNDNNYSVYFMLTEEDDDILPNGQLLSRYTELNKIPTIFFSLSDRLFQNSFNNLTNKQEYLEVMGKVAYIIRKYMDKYDYDVYTYNTDDKKNNFYIYYWKYFNDFLRINMYSKNYSPNGKKIINYLVKDYQRFMFEAKYVKTSENDVLILPWSTREEVDKIVKERKNNGTF